ncbi:MAG: Stp1/IreP family PP2C-type Ser/Thr phosphatase [Peptococcaceae bacterium]|jgi:serine/threonine protein phosphatase PrpC|nr:Stp1/IreP family PP2C-type Ser/Thr phosphatase [Peptococcaceae bacterium]
MKSVAFTHLGAVREKNEDAIYADDGKQLYIVADGMGGYEGGEIASHMALDIVVKDLQEAMGEMDGNQLDTDTLRENLRQAVYHANDSIYQCYQAQEASSPMGTTLTAVYIYGQIAYVAHVGDSRAYLIRAGEGMRQITQDHSVTGEMLRDGEITLEEAKNHPKRHMLTRAIGYYPLVDVDITVLPLVQGDMLFLCTDGLYNLVSEEMIYQSMMSDGARAIPKLILAALDNGGYDNISAISVVDC